MSEYDVTPDEEPLDLAAVNADAQLVESLRRSLSPDAAVVWDDDDEDVDPAFALLRSLQRDVAADLPAAAAVLPVGVTALARQPRGLSRRATVALIAAGVVSIGGVAAAATAPGQPLAGVRHSISSAVENVVQAITPDQPVGPAVAKPSHSAKPSPTAKPSTTPTATPPGQEVSAAVRSTAAAQQVAAELDRAETFLNAGRYTPARSLLDLAGRKLPFVRDAATHDRLANRLAALRGRLDARPAATHAPSSHPTGRPTSAPAAKPSKHANPPASSPKATPSHNPHPRETPRAKPSKGTGSSGKD